MEAGARAASLTSQLLAFGRKQIFTPKVIDLNKVIGNLEKMLLRLIGETIKLDTILNPTLGNVFADASQVDQIIINLVVNAKDAMPDGGKITIETDNVQSAPTTFPAGQTNQFVMITITDSGIGMTPEVKERIFEPFFTTKEVGKGTGLGLSTVYGIVKQSNGFIEVESDPSQGTVFKIYLPRMDKPVAVKNPVASHHQFPEGDATILIVEDEEPVRGLAVEVLAKCGYKILQAGNAERALQIASNCSTDIHLLLTDVVMPGMGGRALSEELRRLRPHIKTIYMSGYTDDAIVKEGLLHGGMNFLQKPFSPLLLAQTVSRVLQDVDK